MIPRKGGGENVWKKHANFFVKQEETLETEMMSQVQNMNYSWHSSININYFDSRFFL